MLAAAAVILSVAAPVHCDAGATMYVDGPLRVFGTAFREHEGGNTVVGHNQYACVGGRRATPLGTDFESTGAFGGGIPKYVFAGGRYLAVASYDYGEGGEDQSLDVVDLRTRRRLKSVNGLWDDDAGPVIRLSANGDLVTGDDGLVTVHPLGGEDSVLSNDGADLAVAGTTVYWTEPGGPRSATLPGRPSEEPDDVLAPVAFSHDNPCDSRPGTTLARTPHVRVVRRGRTTVACQVGSRRAVTLPRGVDDLHVAGDRWLVASAGDDATVIDTRKRRVVTKAFRGVRQALLANGTLVVNDGAGTLKAYAPGAAPTTLEAVGATALASTDTTVYWTAGGAPHSSTA